MIAFDVRGTPVPQGGLVRSPHGGLYHKARPALVDWRQAIAAEARGAIAGSPPLAGPVVLQLGFRFARPETHFLPANSRRPAPELRLDAPVFVTGMPDIDKVTRAALDAMTGVIYLDDSQVTTLSVVKRYADPSEGPGVHVTVRSSEATR